MYFSKAYLPARLRDRKPVLAIARNAARGDIAELRLYNYRFLWSQRRSRIRGMLQPRTHGSPSPAVAAGIVIGMLAMIIIPAAFTLRAVKSPGTLMVGVDASPHGYTWSLLLFIVPIVAIMFWFLPSEGLEIPQRAFWRTIWILVPLGWLLDIIFAQWFFIYPNPLATLRILAPAFGPWVPMIKGGFSTVSWPMATIRSARSIAR